MVLYNFNKGKKEFWFDKSTQQDCRPRSRMSVLLSYPLASVFCDGVSAMLVSIPADKRNNISTLEEMGGMTDHSHSLRKSHYPSSVRHLFFMGECDLSFICLYDKPVGRVWWEISNVTFWSRKMKSKMTAKLKEREE